MSVAPAPGDGAVQKTSAAAGRAPGAAARVRAGLRGNSLLSGSMILLISTTVVNLGNYLYNLLMGRWLGPAAFADVSLMVTLFLVVTLVTSTLQTVAARYSAIYAAGGRVDAQGGLRNWGARWAWLLGLGGAVVMGGGALFWQQFFHTQSPWPFVILGVGVPIYFAQGVDRGVLQGMMRFGVLALSYQAEMWARLFLGVVLVAAGLAVNGAIAALTLSFIAAWLVARQVRRYLPSTTPLPAADVRDARLYAGPVAVALLGQILINNSDVLLVKHYFAPADAGQYAALALIGRIVFFATWSVVMVLLPSVAQREEQGLPHRHLLWLSLGLVGAASVAVVGASFFGGEWVLQILFGDQYLGVAPLLWLYALATTLFALANVFITYDLSLGRRSSSLLALAAGCAQIAGIMLFHDSLAQVVGVQIATMLGLVAVLGVHTWWSSDRRETTTM